jgi:hypothetical protein
MNFLTKSHHSRGDTGRRNPYWIEWKILIVKEGDKAEGKEVFIKTEPI